MSDDLSYEAALAELEGILEAVEEGAVDVDELGLKVRRAAELIRHCRERITAASIEVAAILDELEEADDGE